MSDIVPSPSKVEFKTPNPKSMNLTAEIVSDNGSGDEQDTSVLIPTKSSPAVKLPPVIQEPKLVVSKKRKLQLVASADENIDPSHIIPSKSTNSSVSSKSQRVPSLNDISKPELSPPSLNLSYQSFEESSPALLRTSSPKIGDSSRSFSSPIRLEQSEATSTPNIDAIKDEKKELMALRREENALDAEIRKTKRKLETLKRAKVILGKSDSQNNDELIVKWRDAAQRASSYLLNSAIEKINKSGGKKEFERREKEKVKNNLEFSIDNSFQDRISDITSSEEYEQLPEAEQERILQELEEEAEKSMRQIEKELEQKEKDDEKDADDDDEFTMRDLYTRLKLDFKLVFPDQ